MVKEGFPEQMPLDKAISERREGESTFQATEDGKFKKSHTYCYLLSISVSVILLLSLASNPGTGKPSVSRMDKPVLRFPLILHGPR